MYNYFERFFAIAKAIGYRHSILFDQPWYLSMSQTIPEPVLGIAVVRVTPIMQNCQIHLNRHTQRAFIVDPGGSVSRILEKLRELQVEVEAIVLTHGHFDHIGGVSALREQLGAEIPVLGPFAQDGFFFNKVVSRAAQFGLPCEDGMGDFIPQEQDRFFIQGEILKLVGSEFEVRHTPGHSPGHAILINHAHKYVICGDLVFQQGYGRTDLEGSSQEALEASIRDEIFTLPDDYVIIPGHGATTTVGAEKGYNILNLKF